MGRYHGPRLALGNTHRALHKEVYVWRRYKAGRYYADSWSVRVQTRASLPSAHSHRTLAPTQVEIVVRQTTYNER